MHCLPSFGQRCSESISYFSLYTDIVGEKGRKERLIINYFVIMCIYFAFAKKMNTFELNLKALGHDKGDGRPKYAESLFSRYNTIGWSETDHMN